MSEIWKFILPFFYCKDKCPFFYENNVLGTVLYSAADLLRVVGTSSAKKSQEPSVKSWLQCSLQVLLWLSPAMCYTSSCVFKQA